MCRITSFEISHSGEICFGIFTGSSNLIDVLEIKRVFNAKVQFICGSNSISADCVRHIFRTSGGSYRSTRISKAGTTRENIRIPFHRKTRRCTGMPGLITAIERATVFLLTRKVALRTVSHLLHNTRRLGSLGALDIFQEGRDGDGGQDADDGDNDHELDEGETLFFHSEFFQHVRLLSGCGACSVREVAPGVEFCFASFAIRLGRFASMLPDRREKQVFCCFLVDVGLWGASLWVVAPPLLSLCDIFPRGGRITDAYLWGLSGLWRPPSVALRHLPPRGKNY